MAAWNMYRTEINIQEKIVRKVGYLQGSYQEATSTEHEKYHIRGRKLQNEKKTDNYFEVSCTNWSTAVTLNLVSQLVFFSTDETKLVKFYCFSSLGEFIYLFIFLKCKRNSLDSNWNALKTGCSPSGLENTYEVLLPSVAVNMNAVAPLAFPTWLCRVDTISNDTDIKYGHSSLTTTYDVSRMKSITMWY